MRVEIGRDMCGGTDFRVIELLPPMALCYNAPLFSPQRANVP
jgi:hypothetical protein